MYNIPIEALLQVVSNTKGSTYFINESMNLSLHLQAYKK